MNIYDFSINEAKKCQDLVIEHKQKIISELEVKETLTDSEENELKTARKILRIIQNGQREIAQEIKKG